MNAQEQQQAKMILTALKDGWTVSMKDDDELTFTKNKRNMTQDEQIKVQSEGFSSTFLRSLLK
jgi:hypothetical protein